MLSLITSLLQRLKPGRSGGGERLTAAREALLRELSQLRVDGKPVGHRRLASLMAAAGTTRRETIRLLREIGARPSGRHGKKVWSI